MLVNESLSREIEKATVNAVIQAIVAPGIIFLLLFVFKTEWAGLSFVYWIIPMSIYSIHRRKDIARKIFYRIIASIIAVVMVFGLLVIA